MKSKTFMFFAVAAVGVIVLLCVKSLFFKKDFNILLITMDTTRADRLGCYGYDKNTTPHIDAMAKESVLFSSAVAPVPFTFPSHLTIMTGTLPIYHGSHENDGRPISDQHLTLAEVLKERGYRTGAILASYVLQSKLGLNQGFDTYDVFLDESQGMKNFMNGRRALETAELANQWFQENKDDKFFLFAHFYDPHFPYEPPEPFDAEFEDPYDGEIASVDHAIGQMVDKLKELELYDNTMIIIEADHGEMCGEHGEFGHGYYIYEGNIKVPLIIKLPGSVESRRVSDTVGLVDIFPTVCGALGIKVPDFIQGVDLGPCFEGKPFDQERYQYTESLTSTKFGGNSLMGVVGTPYKYIQTTRPELYDFRQDPAEEDNLFTEDSKRARFMQGNLKHILDTCTKVIDEEEQEVDPALQKQLESLGYIGGGVDTTLSFDQSRPDPKDLKYRHTMYEEALKYAFFQDWDNAKIMMKKVHDEMPDDEFFQDKLAWVWERAVKTAPDKAKAFEEAGDMISRMLKDNKKALANWNEALKSGGGSAELHKKMAAANLNLKNVDEAISHLHLSLYFDPDQADVFKMLGNSVYGLGNEDEAVEYWIKSLKINPDQHQLHDTLVKVYYPRGKYEKVVEHLTESARLQPDNAEVLNNLAWIHSAIRNQAVRNPKLAVEYARRACEMAENKNADYVDTLAIAYAAEGQFPQAIENAQRALKLAVFAGNENLVDEINKRIELYKSNQAYYDKSL